MNKSIIGKILVLIVFGININFYYQKGSKNICGYITEEKRLNNSDTYLVTVKANDVLYPNITAYKLDIEAKEYQFCFENKTNQSDWSKAYFWIFTLMAIAYLLLIMLV